MWCVRLQNNGFQNCNTVNNRESRCSSKISFLQITRSLQIEFCGALDFDIKNFNNKTYCVTEAIGDWFLVIVWCCLRFPHKEFQLCKVSCYTETIKTRFLWAFDFVIAICFCYRATSYATVKLSKENIVKVLHVHIIGNKCFNIHTSKKAFVIRVKCQSRW